MNYTNTAKILHITQPAVSQHIKSLEKTYGVKLFCYNNKVLKLTQEGQVLYEFSIAMKTSSDRVKEKLLNITNENTFLKFGTTLTIGEYTMEPLIKKLLIKHPSIKINMQVANTENLLLKLQKGSIDFAILEGHFDKSKYGYYPFKQESFIGVCAPFHSFVNREINFNEILDENIILRENGSGTRDIFEKVLHELNFTLQSLNSFIEIANMKVIKNLVEDNFGISFLYRESVKEEIRKGTINIIEIKDFNIKREFNFVFLKGTLHEKEYKKWFHFFLSNLNS